MNDEIWIRNWSESKFVDLMVFSMWMCVLSVLLPERKKQIQVGDKTPRNKENYLKFMIFVWNVIWVWNQTWKFRLNTFRAEKCNVTPSRCHSSVSRKSYFQCWHTNLEQFWIVCSTTQIHFMIGPNLGVEYTFGSRKRTFIELVNGFIFVRPHWK